MVFGQKLQDDGPSRDERAHIAKETINKTIPKLLAGDALARAGVNSSTLLTNLTPRLPKPVVAVEGKSQGIRFQVWNTDTISAAQKLHELNSRTAILNMASPLRPGGGVLTGASSQEEFLCGRTTLYPALRDEFYRLPDLSVVYTRDVLVFRDAIGNDLRKPERFHVDVVTAAMLRFPHLVKRNENEDEMTWAEPKDKELVLNKMRAVMRAALGGGVNRLVLGAWGCGAYANPVAEVARAWYTVLVGGRKGKKEDWSGIQEVVFAITREDQAEVFKQVFANKLDVEQGDES